MWKLQVFNYQYRNDLTNIHNRKTLISYLIKWASYNNNNNHKVLFQISMYKKQKTKKSFRVNCSLIVSKNRNSLNFLIMINYNKKTNPLIINSFLTINN